MFSTIGRDERSCIYKYLSKQDLYTLRFVNSHSKREILPVSIRIFDPNNQYLDKSLCNNVESQLKWINWYFCSITKHKCQNDFKSIVDCVAQWGCDLKLMRSLMELLISNVDKIDFYHPDFVKIITILIEASILTERYFWFRRFFLALKHVEPYSFFRPTYRDEILYGIWWKYDRWHETNVNQHIRWVCDQWGPPRRLTFASISDLYGHDLYEFETAEFDKYFYVKAKTMKKIRTYFRTIKNFLNISKCFFIQLLSSDYVWGMLTATGIFIAAKLCVNLHQ